eukprot:375222-Pleurochrysis_carterae.AAC.1
MQSTVWNYQTLCPSLLHGIQVIAHFPLPCILLSVTSSFPTLSASLAPSLALDLDLAFSLPPSLARPRS